MKFIDATEIIVKSGDGGPGLVSFRAARNRPKLGADGGDGGFGGDVYLIADERLNTLSTLRFKKTYRAENGARGGINNRNGRNGADCEVKVPLGTIVHDALTGEHLGELVEIGQKLLVAKGGKRGLGNLRYLSSTHQAPEENTSGGPAIQLTLKLELKLLADVGIAGFPNAGKSTLLSVLSNARPLIADYPFTTLTPQLGVVDVSDVTDIWGSSIVMADIPGLIEGASIGKGLGHEFLKHLERTRCLVYLLDGFLEPEEILDAFNKLKYEVSAYGTLLGSKSFLIVVNKIDLFDPELVVQKKHLINEAFAKIYQGEVLFLTTRT